MTVMEVVVDDIARQLESAREELPDPFDMAAGLPRFFATPVVAGVLAGGRDASEDLLRYLEDRPAPALARVAMLLLSRFPPAWYQARLMAVLGRADRALGEAISAGWWLQDRAEEELAGDLVRAGTAPALFLLQHPAARHVKGELITLARARTSLSRNALFALAYALEASDAPVLRDLSQWTEDVEAAALAGVWLLDLGSREGLASVRAGLSSPVADIRERVYYEFGRRLPQAAVERAGYDPAQPRETAIAELMAVAQRGESR